MYSERDLMNFGVIKKDTEAISLHPSFLVDLILSCDLSNSNEITGYVVNWQFDCLFMYTVGHRNCTLIVSSITVKPSSSMLSFCTGIFQ